MNSIPAPHSVTGNIDWFVHDRFGLFVHWGLYALPARHEWIKHREEIPDSAYDRYFTHFDPDLFDPAEWARRAREAGMKYLVVTAKHHEGFCLWDTAHTDYKAPAAPCGKDLLAEISEAFRAEGLRIGFYYSLIDWHHPHFTIDPVHPLRNHPDAQALNQGRDMNVYRQYMKDQVCELLTNYGTVDILWFDFSYPDRAHRGLTGKGAADWDAEGLLQLVRKLQPHILVNNRLDLDTDLADFHTPEQVQPTEWVRVDGKPVYWEACQTFSGSWGYHRDEKSWKSPGQLIRMLISTVSNGGNLLINVGPTARGSFDDRARKAMTVYADWLSLHSRAIYGCTQSGFVPPPDCRYTQNGNRLYLHIFAWPFKTLKLPGLAGQVHYASFLNDGSEIQCFETENDAKTQAEHSDLTLSLPVEKPPVTVPVIELCLR